MSLICQLTSEDIKHQLIIIIGCIVGQSPGEIKSREGEIKSREGEIKSREGEIKSREGEIKSREGEIKSREGEIKSREVELGSHSQMDRLAAESVVHPATVAFRERGLHVVPLLCRTAVETVIQ